MDEDETTQNPVETGSDQSADDTLDSLFGQPEVTETPSKEEAPVEDDKAAKKERDFERAFFKERELRKQAEAKLSQTPVITQTEAPIDDDGVNFLKGIIRDTLGEQRETQSAMQEVQQKPFFKELESEILRISKDLPDDLTDAQRIRTAYKDAIAENIELVAKSALKVGEEAGFKNRSFKRAQAPVRETPARSGPTNDAYDRYEKGTLTDEEYRELRDDGTLEQWDKEALGI